MGALVLVLAPAFVRLTWPTRPLPPGPLRDRLERLSRRFRFRCTDILVWDTGQALVNAGVTIWLLLTQPVGTYLLAKTVVSFAVMAAAISLSTVWFKSTLRRHGQTSEAW